LIGHCLALRILWDALASRAAAMRSLNPDG
ncbi:MAG: hypothetical protein ACI9LY_003581, partial [Arenicella sp.]